MSRSQQIKRNLNINNVPDKLDDNIFYNLILDEDQKKFRDAIYNRERLVVLANAKAGTGKTTIALGVANIMYQYGLYNGIVYIISPTQEQRQGYLPGDQTSKNAPYMQPLIDALYALDIDPNKAIKSDDNISAQKNGDAYIDFITDTYLRGTNFDNKVVIIDEAQNFYFDDLKKTTTRVKDTCKLIIIGHDKQTDIYKHPERSGFIPYLNAFSNIDDSRKEICELKTNYRGWLSTFCDNVYL